MKNIILVISNKKSLRGEYFFNNLCSHRNIQKINLFLYDKIDKLFQTKNIKSDYLKKPKFFCENLVDNHQLSFKPFLSHLIYFFIIEKPKNLIVNKNECNYYCLRLRRMYELIAKTKNKIVFFDDDVFNIQTYNKCFNFLGLDLKFKLSNKQNVDINGAFDEEIEEFYEKYRYKIIKNFLN